MRKFFAFGLLLCVLVAKAQLSMGIVLNPAISYFSTKFDQSEPSYSTQSFYPMPSVQGGLYVDYSLGEHSVLSAELLFLQVQGKEKMVTEAIGTNGELLGFTITEHISRGVSYFGVPIYYGYRFGKAEYNLGFQVNYAAASYGHEWGGFTDTSDTYYSWDNKANKLYIDKFSFGPRVGFRWQLASRWAINANYYFGLNNILADADISKYWHWKVQQFSVGVQFRLLPRPPTAG